MNFFKLLLGLSHSYPGAGNPWAGRGGHGDLAKLPKKGKMTKNKRFIETMKRVRRERGEG
jgi:hypothetical protein